MQKSTMDWDDVRLFLELVRGGSARSAAASLGISHSTIVRRVERLEGKLGVRLFDRHFTGYRPTAAGETLMTSALAAEDAILAADRQLHGQDARLTGEIRMTTGDLLVQYLLMPEIVSFTESYPEIELSVFLSYDLFDLSRREADVAIRVMQNGRTPPENLIGRKLISGMNCYYASEDYLERHDPWQKDTQARFIGWEEEGLFPEWVQRSPLPHVPAHGNYHNAILQTSGVQAGLGIATLPCFVGDQLAGVIRVPGCEPYENYDLWMLSHPDLRDAARHRIFRQHLADAVMAGRELLLGREPRAASGSPP